MLLKSLLLPDIRPILLFLLFFLVGLDVIHRGIALIHKLNCHRAHGNYNWRAVKFHMKSLAFGGRTCQADGHRFQYLKIKLILVPLV